MIPAKERISFQSHFIGALLAAAGAAYLLIKSGDDPAMFITLLIYGCSATFLFMASSLYHATKKEENDDSIYRKLDHLAIFLMIAGTYTPPSWFYLDGWWRTAIIAAQWTLVLFGIFFKFFYISAPRRLSTAVYVLMGWLAIIPIHRFFMAMPLPMFILMVSGGISFTAGAVIYALKKPDPLPGRFGFHELFHLFILAGAALQFAGMTYIFQR